MPNTTPNRLLLRALSAALLLAPAPLFAAESGTNGTVNWKQSKTWTLAAKPLDFAQTLDNKKVYVLADDGKVHVFTADGRELGGVPVPAGTTAIDIAPRGEQLYVMDAKERRYTALNISFNQTIDITGAPVRGREDAPVTMVEFSDFQCPFCIQLAPVLDKVVADHKDQVRLVFKHMPLTRLHPKAEPAARAAIAAQKQGKFWEMYDALFALGEDGWEADDVVEKTAKKVGLDMARFTKDWKSEETRMQLAKDLMDAQNADVTGTPTVFVNGTPVEDRSPEGLERMIEEALKRPAVPLTR